MFPLLCFFLKGGFYQIELMYKLFTEMQYPNLILTVISTSFFFFSHLKQRFPFIKPGQQLAATIGRIYRGPVYLSTICYFSSWECSAVSGHWAYATCVKLGRIPQSASFWGRFSLESPTVLPPVRCLAVLSCHTLHQEGGTCCALYNRPQLFTDGKNLCFSPSYLRIFDSVLLLQSLEIKIMLQTELL